MPEEGRESPPPETQTGAQLHDPPASGQGVESTENKEKIVKSELENLSSNPKGPMDDALAEKFGKTEKKCSYTTAKSESISVESGELEVPLTIKSQESTRQMA